MPRNEKTNYLIEPFKAIPKNKMAFIQWILGIIIVGPISLWIVLLHDYLTDVATADIYLISSTLVTFSTVILIEGANNLFHYSKVVDRSIASLKGIVSLILLVFVLVNGCTFLIIHQKLTQKIWITIVLMIFSLIFSIYLYCFRDDSWQQTIQDRNKQEDDEVARASEIENDKSFEDYI